MTPLDLAMYGAVAVLGTVALWILSSVQPDLDVPDPFAPPPPPPPPPPPLPPVETGVPSWLSARAYGLGLKAVGFDRMAGERHGFEVEVEGGLEDPTWQAVVRLPWSLPEGARIRLHASGSSTCSGPEADLRWLIADEGVAPVLDELADQGWGATLEGFRLTMRVPPADMNRALDHGTALGLALSERRQAPIQRVAERLGWKGPLGPGTDSLEGVVDGVRVWVMLPFVDGAGWSCSIRATFPTPMPADTEVWAADVGAGPEEELGDLFLDTALHVRTTDPELLRDRLARDAVRGPLLEILCENPGSRLDAVSLIAIRRKGALGVDERLEEVVRLVLDMEPASRV